MTKKISLKLTLLVGLSFYPSTIYAGADSEYMRAAHRYLGVQLAENRFDIEQFRNKKLTFFVGPTGGGKSTTINLLGDIPLDYDLTQQAIQVNGQHQDAMVIGHAGSCTTIPALFRDTGYVDFPGFYDTRAFEQQLANAVSLYEIYKVAKSIKLVFIMDQENFGTRLSELKEKTEHIKNLFGNVAPNFLENSSIFVLTKSRYRTAEAAIAVLQARGHDTSFLSTWVNKGHFYHIKHPDSSGDRISYAERDEILAAINGLTAFETAGTYTKLAIAAVLTKHIDKFKNFFTLEFEEQLHKSVDRIPFEELLKLEIPNVKNITFSDQTLNFLKRFANKLTRPISGIASVLVGAELTVQESPAQILKGQNLWRFFGQALSEENDLQRLADLLPETFRDTKKQFKNDFANVLLTLFKELKHSAEENFINEKKTEWAELTKRYFKPVDDICLDQNIETATIEKCKEWLEQINKAGDLPAVDVIPELRELLEEFVNPTDPIQILQNKALVLFTTEYQTKKTTYLQAIADKRQKLKSTIEKKILAGKEEKGYVEYIVAKKPGTKTFLPLETRSYIRPEITNSERMYLTQLFYKAEDLKNAQAQLDLAELFFDGKLVIRDIKRAFEHYKNASMENDRAKGKLGYTGELPQIIDSFLKDHSVENQLNLGVAYAWGIDRLTKNIDTAITILEDLAYRVNVEEKDRAKVKEAQIFLGLIYSKKEDVNRKPTKAKELFKKAGLDDKTIECLEKFESYETKSIHVWKCDKYIAEAAKAAAPYLRNIETIKFAHGPDEKLLGEVIGFYQSKYPLVKSEKDKSTEPSTKSSGAPEFLPELAFVHLATNFLKLINRI